MFGLLRDAKVGMRERQPLGGAMVVRILVSCAIAAAVLSAVEIAAAASPGVYSGRILGESGGTVSFRVTPSGLVTEFAARVTLTNCSYGLGPVEETFRGPSMQITNDQFKGVHRYSLNESHTLTAEVTVAGSFTGGAVSGVVEIDFPPCLGSFRFSASSAGSTPSSGDRQPPVVRAYPSTGTHGKTAKLQYSVNDDSGFTRVQFTISRGTTKIITARTTKWAASDGSRYYALVRLPAGITGSLKFCVRAWDKTGNASAPSCATLRVT